MNLPQTCSFVIKDLKCNLPSSFILTIKNKQEYLIGTSCNDHLEIMLKKIPILQDKKILPLGKLVIENTKMVGTNCIKGTSKDYEDIKFQRNLKF
ncbi:MAG: hypothetical protein ACPKPY_13660 [Nitrososphaeraceae archaeon]